MSLKEALDLTPLPWSFIAVDAAFLLYGLWPALKPEHFRQTGLGHMRPRALESSVMPAELIRVFAVTWVLMCGFGLVLGIASRL